MVNRGIIQNRTYVGDLAAMMIDSTIKRINGIINLGSIDSSEEIDFLTQLAVKFGYPTSLVGEGEYTPANAFMVPDKIVQSFSKKWNVEESHTLTAIAADPNLQEYMNFKEG